MVANLFLDSVIKRFKEYKELAEKAFAQLGEEALHVVPNEASNSIAVIIRHLEGNMKSRWTNFLTEDGEKEWRNRDEEFEERAGSKAELLEKWNAGWTVFLDALAALQPEDLTRTITIRSQPLLVVDAINRQMAHYSYHVGQIVYLARWIRNEEWRSLSIPRGDSRRFNEEMQQSRH